MSPPVETRRRADARRNIETILDAAVELLSERPEASLAQIAESAGVTRQTVYAHYSSREALLAAVAERAMEQSVAAIDAAELERGPAPEALDRLIAASWRVLGRHAPLIETLHGAAGGEELHALHAPIRDRLARLIRRGQRERGFAPGVSARWAPAAVIALFHAAAQEVAAGRLSAARADRELRLSVRRLLGAGGA